MLPKKLKIGANTYDIILSHIEDEDAEVDTKKLTITIDKRLPATQRICSLFHEIFHALNIEADEKDVEFWAQGISQVLLDNNLLKIRTKK